MSHRIINEYADEDRAMQAEIDREFPDGVPMSQAEIDAQNAYEANMRREDAAEAARIKVVEVAADAWKAKWPNHCTGCKGWGGATVSTYPDSPDDFDVCDALPDAHTCHRCGALGLDDDGNGPCAGCGWNYDDGMPQA
jgi:hypothetical protein